MGAETLIHLANRRRPDYLANNLGGAITPTMRTRDIIRLATKPHKEPQELAALLRQLTRLSKSARKEVIPVLESQLSVRLGNALFPEAKAIYDALVPPDLQVIYEYSLHQVKRMKSMVEQGFIREDQRESNLEHTYMGLEMAKEYQAKSPDLNSDKGGPVNFAMVQLLFLFHDAGEIDPRIGDVQPLHRLERDERRKLLESYVAWKSIISRIPDPQNRYTAREFYDRYQTGAQRDLDVQMARYIDKASGTTRASRPGGPFDIRRRELDDKIKIGIMNHLFETVLSMQPPYDNLMIHLPTKKQRRAMKRINEQEFRLIKNNGPEVVVRSYIETFRRNRRSA